MKKNQSFYFAFIILVFFALTVPLSSCKKYEEGPYLSLRSKTERIANSWTIGKVIDNGKDVTNDYSELKVNFTKGGDCSWTTGDGGIAFTRNGTWQFVNDKYEIQTIMPEIIGSGNVIRTFQILKLKEDELWLKEGDREYQLIPA